MLLSIEVYCIHIKCAVWDQLQQRLMLYVHVHTYALIVILQGGSKQVVFVPTALPYGGTVEQGVAIVTQICIQKIEGVFGYVVCHDLALLLWSSRNWEEILNAVFWMKLLILCGSARRGVQFLRWAGWDRSWCCDFFFDKGCLVSWVYFMSTLFTSDSFGC